MSWQCGEWCKWRGVGSAWGTDGVKSKASTKCLWILCERKILSYVFWCPDKTFIFAFSGKHLRKPIVHFIWSPSLSWYKRETLGIRYFISQGRVGGRGWWSGERRRKRAENNHEIPWGRMVCRQLLTEMTSGRARELCTRRDIFLLGFWTRTWEGSVSFVSLQDLIWFRYESLHAKNNIIFC